MYSGPGVPRNAWTGLREVRGTLAGMTPLGLALLGESPTGDLDQVCPVTDLDGVDAYPGDPDADPP